MQTVYRSLPVITSVLGRSAAGKNQPYPPEATAHFDNTENLVSALFARIMTEQPFTAQHSLRTQRIALEIAARLKIVNDIELGYLKWGVLLHDFGKLSLPLDLLLKAEELTFAEYEILTGHARLGYAALEGLLPRKVLEVVLYHHERYDGAGYPCGREGNQIPILAKICSVAEAYDAMIETNDHHAGLTLEAAADEIIWNCGTQFDPMVVTAFLDYININEHADLAV